MPDLVQIRVDVPLAKMLGMHANFAALVLLVACGLVPAEARTIGDCRIGPGALCVEARLSGADLSGENLARAGFHGRFARGQLKSRQSAQRQSQRSELERGRFDRRSA